MRRWAVAAGVGVLILLHAWALARWLRYPDLNLDYPFRGADDFDWISNAHALGGADVRYTGRPPLYPLLLLGLKRAGTLSWAPLVQQSLLALFALAVFLVAGRRSSPTVAAVIAAWLYFAAPFQNLALGISADLLAAVLLVLASWAWLKSGQRGPWWVAAGVLAGMSLITSPAAWLWLAAVFLLTLAERERPPFSWCAAALAATLAPAAAWRLLGPPGSGSESAVIYARLLSLKLSFGFYALALLALTGVPGAFAALAGTRIAWRERGERAARLALVYGLLLAVFFGAFYDYASARFLIYAAPVLALFAASALSRLESRPAWLAIASAVLVAGSAWPAPPGFDAAAVLLPFPRVVLAAHPPIQAPFAPHWLRPQGPIWEDSALARARKASTIAAPAAAIAPRQVRGARAVIYVAAVTDGPGLRSERQTRLGNTLLRRVRVVDPRLIPAAWWGGGSFRRLGEILGVPVYRGAWPGGRAFVVAAGDAEVAAALDQRSATGPPAIDRKEWLLAAGVAATARPPDGLLLALGEADRDGNWLRLLPVVARTSSLFVPVGEDREELVALAAQQPCLDRSQIDGVALCNMKILRWPVRVAIAPSLRDRVLAGGAAPNP